MFKIKNGKCEFNKTENNGVNPSYIVQWLICILDMVEETGVPVENHQLAISH
jgi:hypothetical protein